MRFTIPIGLLAAAALALSGCSADVDSSAPNPTPSSTHQAEPGEPVLVSVPGYQFVGSPAASQMVTALVTAEPSLYAGGSAHQVTTNQGLAVGDLMIMTMTPTRAAWTGPYDFEYLLETYTDLTGDQGWVEDMSGEPVITGPVVAQEKTILWFHEGEVAVFHGRDPNFMSEYLASHA